MNTHTRFWPGIFAIAVMISFACSALDSEPSSDELRAEIESAVKPGDGLVVIQSRYGSTDDCVEGSHVTTAERVDRVFLLNEYGLRPDEPVFCFIVERPSQQLRIVFVLDSALRFERLIILEYNRGL